MVKNSHDMKKNMKIFNNKTKMNHFMNQPTKQKLTNTPHHPTTP
ncbi:MAG: hypothetical protein Q7V10_06200 [Methanobacteriaceae archaeon]|nr:hypothetical protein [Methanobacteriaceae archaeon]MDO9626641.1 hypothetical protein [Methanobacteriaceae archaeon]